jgi:uncharacterized membrane protein YfcA
VVPDLLFFAVAVPAVLIAGLSKGGFGGAGAFVATPILALVIDPALALGLMLPLLMLIDVAALKAYWRGWHRPAARAMLWGAVPGIALGWAFYRSADPDLIRLLIGSIAVAFVLFQAVRAAGFLQPRPAAFSATRGGVAGCAAGLASFVSHAGGPPVLMFLLPLGLSKTVFQATTVVFFWAINLMKVPAYLALGFFTADTLLAGAALAPVAILGVWLGVRAHRLVPQGPFFLLTYALLLAAGTRLIWVALA